MKQNNCQHTEIIIRDDQVLLRIINHINRIIIISKLGSNYYVYKKLTQKLTLIKSFTMNFYLNNLSLNNLENLTDISFNGSNYRNLNYVNYNSVYIYMADIYSSAIGHMDTIPIDTNYFLIWFNFKTYIFRCVYLVST